MEKKLKSYETLFVIDADLSEEDTKAAVEKFTALISQHGEIEEVNEWGKRKLAYPIDYKTEGYYVLVTFKSEPDFPSELERIFNITDNILRSIVIAKEEKSA
ncbi:MAG: 30S ribosomal protein S6 [Clostridia bacterium]|nr:30S ribosomal protein S6 [Clostridia bacterium]